MSVTAAAVSSGFTATGQTLAYSYLVTNAGTAALHNVTINDDHAAGNIACPQPTLARGASETCTGSYTTTQADTDAGSVTSTATATAVDSTGVALSSSASSVTITGSPASTLSVTYRPPRPTPPPANHSPTTTRSPTPVRPPCAACGWPTITWAGGV